MVCCSGESLDEMRLLEEQARRIAEEANKDKPKTMTFVKLAQQFLFYHLNLLFAGCICICITEESMRNVHYDFCSTLQYVQLASPLTMLYNTIILFEFFHCAPRSSEASAEMEEMAKVSGANPDEIELGDSGGEEEEGPEPVPEPTHNQKEVEIQEQVVPSAVFGSIPEEMQGAVLGARQRFSLTKKTS